MNRSKWRDYAAAVALSALCPDPDFRWVAYPHPVKNARSAQSIASAMRKAMPYLEIKTRLGVIYARQRGEAASA